MHGRRALSRVNRSVKRMASGEWHAAPVEITRRIYAGEPKPDPANLNLAIALAGIEPTTAA
jgi:hypothetical protein